MVISIHQPNFFPHVGFFEKMKQSDVFVLLTHCQWSKNGYQNRFQYERWHTMSVDGGKATIKDKRYKNPFKDWAKIKTNLKQFDLSIFDKHICSDLTKTNTAIIETIAEKLNIKTPIYFDFPTKLTATARLVEICEMRGADTYLSGPSGRSYLELKRFKDAGIKVIFQEHKPSIPILDKLWNS